MILFMFLSMLISCMLMALIASTPIMLGMNILTTAMVLAASFASLMSSWYSLLIFLIYVGGMLVMFSYFMALTPNKQFSYTSMMLHFSMSSLILMTLFIFTNQVPPMNLSHSFSSSLLYMSNWSNMLIIMALLLFLVMVVVVKITMRSKGPLRPFM